MRRPIEDPVTVEKPGPGGDPVRVTTHPAFAQIGAFRSQGGRGYLYGSDFGHNAVMTIRIKLSEVHRNLSSDWHHARNTLIEVCLSEAQWATFVSAPNIGDGVPCTLMFAEARGEIPGLPEPEKRVDQFSGEMKRQVAKAIDRIDELMTRKDVTKRVKDELRMVRQDIMSNMPFVAERFDKHMEGTVEKAKSEIHGYMTGVVNRAGLAALGGTLPLQLEDQSDDD